MYTGLAMNFGHHTNERTEPVLTQKLTKLYNGGVRKLRMNILIYATEYGNTTFRDQLRLMCTTWLNYASDTQVIWGYDTESTMTLSILTGAYHDAFVKSSTSEGFAYWVASLPADQQRRFEIQIANEDDQRVDGTTLTATAWRDYLTGTMATDILTVVPTAQVSVSIRQDFLSSWQSHGIGSLTRIGMTLYKSENTFKNKVDSLVGTFGTSAYLTEFGYIDESAGINFYKGDDEANNRCAFWQMDYCRKKGIECCYFVFETEAGTEFNIYSSSTGIFKGSWYAMTDKRERYISVITPR